VGALKLSTEDVSVEPLRREGRIVVYVILVVIAVVLVGALLLVRRRQA
jgi:hypothetical protein